ncbi:MAG: response regulator, partial [Spirochaetes bacterium]|nr:response regulator [Spirochaetota bacterium]
MKILIVDDESALRFALSELLINEGDEINECSNGEEALEILTDQMHDLVILDYQLPGIQGLDVLKEIKKKFSDIYVIFITAFGIHHSPDNTTENIAVSAIKFGAYDYVAKPFDNRELLNRINHLKEALQQKKINNTAQYGAYFSPAMH